MKSNNLPSFIKLSKKIEEDNINLIIVPERINNPHYLINLTKKYWKDSQNIRDYSLRDKVLSISVTKPNENRALRFMNALIKLLEAKRA